MIQMYSFTHAMAVRNDGIGNPPLENQNRTPRLRKPAYSWSLDPGPPPAVQPQQQPRAPTAPITSL